MGPAHVVGAPWGMVSNASRSAPLAFFAVLSACPACDAPTALPDGGSGDAGSVVDAASVADAPAVGDAALLPDAASPPDAGPPPADWLVAGQRSTCASRAGRVLCWGRSWMGFDRTTPAEVPELSGARGLALGGGHACAILGDGRVACAGENRGGQLGISPRELERRDSFEVVPGAPTATQVAVSQGGSTACALATDATVWCWGDDSLGQTGSPIPRHAPGSVAPQPTPARVEGVDGAVEIAMGQYQACALLADGRVRCWGYDWFGALGRGEAYTGVAQHEPADVEGIDDAFDLAFDGNGGCVLRESGEVACWGGQVYLYPGYDAATDDECSVVVSQVCWRAPRPIALPLASVLLLGGGAGCVRSDAWSCFGRTLDGLVGAEGLANDATVVMGIGHLCAMTGEGEILCRGRGDEGQLGDGRASSASDWVSPSLP